MGSEEEYSEEDSFSYTGDAYDERGSLSEELDYPEGEIIESGEDLSSEEDEGVKYSKVTPSKVPPSEWDKGVRKVTSSKVPSSKGRITKSPHTHQHITSHEGNLSNISTRGSPNIEHKGVGRGGQMETSKSVNVMRGGQLKSPLGIRGLYEQPPSSTPPTKRGTTKSETTKGGTKSQYRSTEYTTTGGRVSGRKKSVSSHRESDVVETKKQVRKVLSSLKGSDILLPNVIGEGRTAFSGQFISQSDEDIPSTSVYGEGSIFKTTLPEGVSRELVSTLDDPILSEIIRRVYFLLERTMMKSSTPDHIMYNSRFIAYSLHYKCGYPEDIESLLVKVSKRLQ